MHFRLSTYLLASIATLVVISTTIVSGVIYLSLKDNLTSEFRERIKAENGELGFILKNRLAMIENQLKSMALDNTIRITLMLGVNQQLQDYLDQISPKEQDLHVFIIRSETEEVFTSSKLDIDIQRTWSALYEKGLSKLLENDPKQGFKLTLVFPIHRQKSLIGYLIGVYFFGKDDVLVSFIGNSEGSQALVLQNGNLWNLITGEKSLLIKNIDDDFRTDVDFPHIYFEKEKLIFNSRTELPGLYLTASLHGLDRKTQKVFYLILLPALVVVLLTITISLFLSNKLASPLHQISKLALKAAEGKSNLSEHVDSSIVEIEGLIFSLRTMLKKLQRAQELHRYQELFDNVADIVLIHNYDGKIIEANKVAWDVLSSPERDLLTIGLSDIVPEEDHNRITDAFENLYRQDSEIRFEATLMTGNGEGIAFECHARKIYYDNKAVVLNVARDITDRKLAEQSLAESHQTIHTILNSIEATIYVADLETHEILFMNKHMKKIFGGDLQGEKCYQAFWNKDRPCSQCTNKKLVGPDNIHLEVVAHEGENPMTNRWYAYHDRAIRWLDHRLVRFQIAFDITEMKALEKEKERSEEQLRKVQKMEAIGTLAGGVAHDLNNILSGLVSYPDLLLYQIPDDSPFKKPIQTIKKTGEKAAAIVQDMLTLARRGVVTNEVVSLNQITREYLQSPEHDKLISFHPNVEVKINLGEGLLNILGSPVHLSKTIMNLVSNAAEAIQDEGTITITTRDRIVEAPIGGYEEIKAGEYILLSIEDTGSGMAPEDCEKIFEPFYTKKAMGRSGTGLGMSVVWSTIKDHEGFIDMSTEVEKGTTFHLYFPTTRKALTKEHLNLPIEAYKGDGETILVVDDVKEQRDVATMILTRLNYSVTAVPSGEEAIEYLRENTADLVILDMVMDPGIDGLETYKGILEIHPGQRAIITTGYSETERVKEARELGARQYVKKPYVLEKIALAVKGELAQA